ncbi:hypothetical protein [Geomonas subterranea]|uniref:hypothetical protein n=1 Tax=Geomonas subterranea TaxID=2847989 RepID=UPI001CD1958A|nr:hypothetical protein [Geomonas fuzhouensis]
MVICEFNVPFSVDLTKESCWNKALDHPYGYYTIRCHFQIRERQAGDPALYGRKLAIFETCNGVQPETIHTIKTRLIATQVRESFCESLKQNESLQKFTSMLSSALSASNVGKVSSECKVEAQDKLVESFRDSFRFQTLVTKEEEREYKLTYKIDSSITTRLVTVAMYQRYVYDLYLTWVDYLNVRYIKGPLALRKKRIKRPIVDGCSHVNWIKFNLPLASASIWRPLPDSAVVIPEASYRNEVDAMEEFTVGAPEDYHKYFVARPDCPTLYQISNVAFPLKWVKRKTDYTEDELKAIEEGETDAISWFWRSNVM